MVKVIAIHFARLGPYHVARLDSAVQAMGPLGWTVVALETAGSDSTYSWDRTDAGAADFTRKTIFPDQVFENIPSAEIKRGVFNALDQLRPAAMAIAGWGTVDARACLAWCKKNNALAIVMSETRVADGQRVWWKEWVKSRIVRQFDGALCGGGSHRNYLVELGIPKNRIEFGYNIVDNDFFKPSSNNLKTEPYFLSSNRFISRKNLVRLIQAYAKYVKSIQASGIRVQGEEGTSIWPLVLLGDGELRGELMQHSSELGLTIVEYDEGQDLKRNSYKFKTPADGGAVVLAGFRQIQELPEFYARAGAFIHPEMEEPWGLVINEAMAAGLPVLSSYNVGAAEELVVDGKTGYLFDPRNIDEMANAMSKVAGMTQEEQLTMGRAAFEMVERKAPAKAFGEGLAKLLMGKL